MVGGRKDERGRIENSETERAEFERERDRRRDREGWRERESEREREVKREKEREREREEKRALLPEAFPSAAALFTKLFLQPAGPTYWVWLPVILR